MLTKTYIYNRDRHPEAIRVLTTSDFYVEEDNVKTFSDFIDAHHFLKGAQKGNQLTIIVDDLVAAALGDERKNFGNIVIKNSTKGSLNTEEIPKLSLVEVQKPDDAGFLAEACEWISVNYPDYLAADIDFQALSKQFKLVVTGVNTYTEFHELYEDGIAYMHGPFIETPESISFTQLPPNKIGVLHLIGSNSKSGSKVSFRVYNIPKHVAYRHFEIFITLYLRSVVHS